MTCFLYIVGICSIEKIQFVLISTAMSTYVFYKPEYFGDTLYIKQYLYYLNMTVSTSDPWYLHARKSWRYVLYKKHCILY